MAKRSGAANLAGLAALGALGYMALKGKKGEAATVENKDFTSSGASDDSDMRRRAEAEGAKVSPAEADGPGPRDAQSMDGIDYTAGVTKRAKPVAPKAARTVGGPDERYTAGSTPPATSVSSRDQLRQSERSMGPSLDTAAETASLAARYPTKNRPKTRAEIDAEQLESARNIPLFRGARAVGNELATADKRYFQGKLDRGERLNETEKAQARRAGLTGFKKGGEVKAKKMASGGVTRSSASSRGDGIAQRGKTRGTMVACGGGYMKGKK